MQVKVLNSKENKLLNRTEVELEAGNSKVTPARKELVQKIAETLNIKPELIVIQKIEQQFGTHSNKVWARTYQSRENLEKIELKYLVGRDKGEKKKPGKKTKKEPKKKQ